MGSQKIKIKVYPNAKKQGVEKISEDYFKVWVNVAPEKGKANKRVIELLAKEFNLAKYRITIIKGDTNREKIISIDL